MAVVLLLIASIAGLRVPLSPALVHVSPSRIMPGEVMIDVTGYNTRFADGMRTYLVNDNQYVCPISVDVIDATHARIVAEVPAGMRASMTDIVVQGMTYPGAFFTESLGEGIESGSCAPTPPKLDLTGLGFTFPNRSILYESIRNLFFHVPMWFTMIALMGIAFWQSIKVLGNTDLERDRAARSAVQVGLLFCGLGLVTGAVWARATWGAFWTNDVKLNGAAVTALIYLAYLVLRGSIPDLYKRARLAAIYNIFAFVLLVLFLFVVPRLNAIDSLHPGNGGNSGFNDLDLDNRLRIVFYPAVAGWVMLGIWMMDLRTRTARLIEQMDR
ncbi:MAG TPA: cytochrome c biogenesis protein CcsA [Flavobacteriales bacterium]|nr:cytochrome c biogenesis protein CcsA [Flavobacteriales bacterium]